MELILRRQYLFIHGPINSGNTKKNYQHSLPIIFKFLTVRPEKSNRTGIIKTINSFVLYLPSVIEAGLVFVIGLVIAQFVRNVVENATKQISPDYSGTIGRAIHIILVVVICVLAIGQLQLETVLLNRIIEIILLACGVSLALSLGLGTRDISRNIISGYYARAGYSVSSIVKVGESEGVVKSIGTVCTEVEGTAGERILIPICMLLETIVGGRKT